VRRFRMPDKAYILGVDDEPVNRIILEEFLEDAFEYKIVSSGEECLKAVKDKKPDLILLDVSMPGIDGLETCNLLHSEPETETIPVIFVSALASPEERIAGYEAGGDDYVPKPFTKNELLSKIQIALKNRQAIEEISRTAEYATSAAMTAMTNAGELGALLQFLRESFLCNDFDSLAKCMWTAISSYGLSGNILINESTGNTHFYTSDGIERPLEEKIMLQMKNNGRIVEFGSRNIYNALKISLLIRMMPMDELDKCGRLKDHLAIFIEGADARIDGIGTQQKLAERHQALSNFIMLARETLTEIDTQHRIQRKDNVQLLSDLVQDVEASFIQLGLTEEQEEQLLRMVSSTEAKTDSLYEKGLRIDAKFDQITKYMNDTFG